MSATTDVSPLPAPRITPVASSAVVRAKMQAQSTFDTKPEVSLRRELHRRGVRVRLDQAIPTQKRRRADIVWRRRKLAVFVDGCFWHGCPKHGRKSAFTGPNASLWAEKMERNAARDKRSSEIAESLGWTVVRLWECEVRQHSEVHAAELIRKGTTASGLPTGAFGLGAAVSRSGPSPDPSST